MDMDVEDDSPAAGPEADVNAEDEPQNDKKVDIAANVKTRRKRKQ